MSHFEDQTQITIANFNTVMREMENQFMNAYGVATDVRTSYSNWRKKQIQRNIRKKAILRLFQIEYAYHLDEFSNEIVGKKCKHYWVIIKTE